MNNKEIDKRLKEIDNRVFTLNDHSRNNFFVGMYGLLKGLLLTAKLSDIDYETAFEIMIKDLKEQEALNKGR